MDNQVPVFVAGSQTLIGSAIVEALQQRGFANLVGLADAAPDLHDAAQVEAFFARTRPAYVFMAAGKSGGIQANRQYPADFMLDNLQIVTHVIPSAYRHGCRKLLYLLSSCSYPRLCAQPMPVEAILTGALEPTNEAYALAKLAATASAGRIASNTAPISSWASRQISSGRAITSARKTRTWCRR